ncbi:MAG: SH3 domain-containing protein [Spirochaetales bacterium]|nr:SH3 domain-containing protein [Spirochaetales bacterium]
MKKYFLSLILIISLAFLFTACEKKDSASSVTDQKKIEPTPVPTYNSIHNALTYIVENEDSDRPVYSKGSFRPALGDKFFTIGEAIEVASKDEGGETLKLIKCKSEDDEIFWMKNDLVVPDGILAIVKDDESVIYEKPNKLKPSSDILSKATIVTVYPESENGFKLVTTWDEKINKKRSNVYIKTGDLSFSDDDIQSYRIYFIATKASGVAQKTLFETALEYSNSIFYNLIEDEYNKRYNNSTSESSTPSQNDSVKMPETETIEFNAVIANDGTGEMINVRNFPLVNGSSVVAQLNPGEPVFITEATVKNFTIGAISDKWYKISSPEGWVFGSFIDPQ